MTDFILLCYTTTVIKGKSENFIMGLIENFQERRNAKFESMVADSVVRKTKTIPAKKLHLVGAEKRKWSLLLLLVTFLYTIFTKVILEKSGFDLLIALNIGLFITDLYLRANGNSIWALNHPQRMNFINTLNKLITTVIFFWTTYLQGEDLLNYITANQETVDGLMAAAGSQGAGNGIYRIFGILCGNVYPDTFLLY